MGVHSGFIPFDNGASGMVGTFNMFVNTTDPMYLYCAQASHCQSGMVMMVNGQESDLVTFAKTAATATSNVPAAQVAGGCAAQIPLEGALVPVPASVPVPTPTATEYTTVYVGPTGMPGMNSTTGPQPPPNATAPFVLFTGAASSLMKGSNNNNNGGINAWMGSVVVTAGATALGAILLVRTSL